MFVAANLDPCAAHGCLVDVPIAALGIGASQPYRMRELITDREYEWRGPRGYVDLHPDVEPAQIFVLQR